MQKQIYELRNKLDALTARVEELERFRGFFQPSFRERIVKKTSKPGLCADTLAENWLRERGYEWQDREELDRLLRKNDRVRRELFDFIRGRAVECSSSSLAQVMNYLKSFAPFEHQND